jgi:protein-S-isoprenylcysteine O-methyltransferase Ste14
MTSRLLIFAAGTILVVPFSWFFSIKDRRYHGVARFFSFESILGLVLLNSQYWFERPLSLPQTVSWILLAVSAFLAIHGFYLLQRLGKPHGHIETTTQLVTRGAYRFIRHPLYASLVLFGIGAFLKHIDGLTSALAAVNILALFVTARLEEGEMLVKFGAEYAAYRKRSKMFIPFVL